jgi:hypothetical protein
MRDGSLHPAELRLPLIATLSIQRLAKVKRETLKVAIIDLPLMMGFREREGELTFELPDMFWVDGGNLANGGSGQIVAVADSIRYDGRTTLLTILESILRRTLTDRSSGRSLKAKLKKPVFKHQEFSGRNQLGQGFMRRLCSNYQTITDSPIRDTDLLRLVSLPVECAVAASPLLTGKMVFVNRNLAKAGALSSPFVANYTVGIENSPIQPDNLTPTPTGEPTSRTLGEDGIVKVGVLVHPGEPLVGIESIKPFDELSAEEKLLRAIFGDTNPQTVDSSLIFEGPTPGRVLAVNVHLAKQSNGLWIQDGPGKLIRRSPDVKLPLGELARITISLSINQPVQVGDLIYSDEKCEGVICRISSGLSLARFIGRPSEPDLVVSPDHPWAPSPSEDEYRYVTVRVSGDTLLAQEAVSRSTGPYSLISQKPLNLDNDPDPAQKLEPEDFLWLFACEARNVAFELAGPRCDCNEWRRMLVQGLVMEDSFRLNGLPSLSPSSGLLDSQSEGIKYFGLCLLATGLNVSRSLELPLTFTFSLMSDSERLALSYGEVTAPETINYRTYRPVSDGLFCGKIFGPVTDFECFCRKYVGEKHHGVVCEQCGVEVTESSVRRNRMGHISLSVPVVNPLYLKSFCAFLSSQYKLPAEDLRATIYFEKRLVVVNKRSGSPAIFIDDNESQSKRRSRPGVSYYYGGAAIQKLLEGLNDRAASGELSGDWQNIIMNSVLVLPPNRRPLVPMGNGRFVSSDLNDFYRRIINYNNRLKKLVELKAPAPIIHHECAMLQQGIDWLFDNQNSDQPKIDHNRPLKSLTEHIQDFSGNCSSLLDGILTKPVDYSARTRLVVGDTGDLDTAIFPELFIWKLLRPKILHDLRKNDLPTLKAATQEFNRRTPRAYEALERACSQAFILAAPKLSRWRLIALRPKFSGELALVIHPQLMDLIGWENLGKEVKLFSVLSEEATNEVAQKLLPNVLRAASLPTVTIASQFEKESSMLFIEKNRIASDLANRSLFRKSYVLSSFDKLAMCIR